MAKNVEDVVRTLKLKAHPKQEALTFRHGAKKYTLPFEVRSLASSDYLFVHIPPSAGVLKITANGLELVEKVDEAVTAQKTFRENKRKKSRRSSAKVELPTELASALSKIPSGHKLVYGKDGQPRLAKTRTRTKKS